MIIFPPQKNSDSFSEENEDVSETLPNPFSDAPHDGDNKHRGVK